MPRQYRKPHIPKRRIEWRRLTVWKVLYRTKSGKDEILIKTITRPEKTKILRTPSGRKKFHAVAATKQPQEVIIVAKGKKSKAISDGELEELESLEELDEDEEEDEDLEDEDVDTDEDEDEDSDDDDDDDDEEDDEDEEDEEEPDEEDEDEDDDEEEDEEPAPKKSKKSKSKSKGKKKEKQGVGTAEVAEAAGISGRELRVLLRRHDIPKDDESGRYEWSSLNHPQVKKILKLVSKGEHKKAQKERLDKVSKKKGSKDKKSKGSKDTKKAKAGKKGGKKNKKS